MAEIKHFIDKESVKGDAEFMLDNLDHILLQFKKINAIKIKLDGDKSFKEIADSVTKLKKEEDELLKLQSQIESAYKKRIALESQQAKILAEEKELMRQRNAELKNQVREQNAAEGSLEQLRATLIRLNKEYDNLSKAERESAKGSDLKNKIVETVNSLKQLEGETGRFQRNVGNYTGAVGILEKALTDVSQKIDQLGKSGGNNAQQLEKLRQEQEFLQQVLNKNAQGFASLAMEVRANERALATMFAEGMKNTEAYKALEQQVSNAKRELGEFKEQQAILASQTPAIAAATTAAKGLAGAYAIGAGTAAVFGDEEGKVEKELQKLVAVMTVLQGLQEVHELLEKRGTIAKVASNIATGAQVAWQRILAATMLQSAVASTVLRVALIGLTGGLLLLIPLIATAASSYAKQERATSNLRDAQNELSTEFKNTAQKVTETKIKIDSMVETVKKGGLSFDEKKKFVREYNKELGDTLGTAHNYNEAEKNLIEKSDAYVKALYIRAQAQAALNLATKEQEKIFNEQIDAQRSVQATIDHFNNAVAEGTVTRAQADKEIEAYKKRRALRQNEETKDAEQRQGFFKTQFTALTKEAEELEKAKNFTTNPDDGKAKRDEQKKASEAEVIRMEQAADKLKAISDDERRTFEQRNAALESYYDLRKKIIEKKAAQAIYDNPDAPTSDIEANKNKELQALETERQNTVRKFRQDFDNKLLADQKAVNNFRLEQQAKANEQIAANDNESVQTRLEALQKYSDAQKAIVEADYKEQLRLLNQRSHNKEEEVLLEAQADAKIVEIAANTEAKTIEILKSALEKKKELQQEQEEALQRQLSAAETSGTQAYAKDVAALNESLQRKEISVEQYNTKRQALDQIYARQLLLNQNKNLQDQLKLFEDLGVQRISIEQQIHDVEEQLAKTTSQSDRKKLQDKLNLLKEELKANLDNSEKVKAIKKQLADTEKQLSDDTTKLQIENLQKIHDLQKELANKVYELIQTVVLAGYDKEKKALEDKKTAVDEQKNDEIAAINAQALTAEEKAARITIVEKKAQAEKDRIAKQEQDIEIKKAKAEKLSSLLKIAIETTTQVFKIKAQAAALIANPITAAYAPLALSQIPYVIASGIASAALIAAQPIPKYRHGREDGPATLAIVGDGGKREVVSIPGVGDYLTPATDTLTYLPAHAKVYPDVERYQRAAFNSSFKTPQLPSLVDHNRYMNDQIIREMRATREAIRSIPLQQFKLDEDGFSKWVQNGDNFTEYINKMVKS